MRILVFGASGGFGIGDMEDSGWIDRLKFYLGKETNWGIQTYNLCVSGHASENLLDYMETDCESRTSGNHETVILIQLGVNDAQTDKDGNWTRNSPEGFEENLMKIIKISKKYTKKIVFISGYGIDQTKTMPIPWNKTVYYRDSDIEKMISTLKSVSEKENILFIELKGIPLSDDGLHTFHRA